MIGYVRKRMPAAKIFSITELELCGLAMNIVSFAQLLRKVDFDVLFVHPYIL